MTTAIKDETGIWQSMRQQTDEALEKATDYARDYLNTGLERSSLVRQIRTMKQRITEIERDTLLGSNFDGKTADLRAAQLQRALWQNDEYNSHQRQLADCEGRLAYLDVVMEHLRQTMSIRRLTARWNVAVAEAWGAK